MTAALETQHRANRLRNEPVYAESIPQAHLHSVELMQSPEHRPLFTYICRSLAGQGDTISK